MNEQKDEKQKEQKSLSLIEKGVLSILSWIDAKTKLLPIFLSKISEKFGKEIDEAPKKTKEEIEKDEKEYKENEAIFEILLNVAFQKIKKGAERVIKKVANVTKNNFAVKNSLDDGISADQLSPFDIYH